MADKIYNLKFTMSDGSVVDAGNFVAPQGEKGEKGARGAQGAQGIQGEKGDKGDKGEKGDQGIQGEKGDKGADGTMTFTDLTDEQKASLKGEKGDTGEKGEKGDKGDTGAQGVQGIQGEKGEKGDKGDPGGQANAVTGSGAITITLADNTEYRYTSVTSLSMTYPSGNFECWIRITVGSSAATVSFPAGTTYIGTVPTFSSYGVFEISIKDKIAVIRKVGT